MSHELTIYQKVGDPRAAVKEWGLSIAKSKIFNVETIEQGEVFALECLARGMPPLTLAQKFHVIFGRLSMKAEAMHENFLDHGGNVILLERSPERAAIELTIKAQTHRFELTWEEAQQEPFVYEGKEADIVKTLSKGQKPVLKPKYATPRSRMQMLWARVISDAIGAMDPKSRSGVYTPEEIEDFDELQDQVNGHAKDANGRGRKKAAVQSSTTDAQAPAVAADGEIVDAEFEVTPEPATPTETEPPFDPPKATAVTEPVGAACSADQASRIKELWGLLDVQLEDRDKQMASRKVTSPRSLTAEQATVLIGKMETELARRQAAAAPCTTEVASAIRAKLTEVNQVIPGIITKFKERMGVAGLNQISDLTQGDAEGLLAALNAPTALEQYLGASLWPTKKASGSAEKN